jgi:hypothetical protein
MSKWIIARASIRTILAAAQVFCEDTLHSAKFHFGLSEYMEKSTSPNNIIDALEEIECHFRETCSRSRYWHHWNLSWSLTLASRIVSATIQWAGVLYKHGRQEQRIHLADIISTLDEYKLIRMGTSAVGLTLACVEWIRAYWTHSDLSNPLWPHEQVHVSDPFTKRYDDGLYGQANVGWCESSRIHISSTVNWSAGTAGSNYETARANDILSMKKEIVSTPQELQYAMKLRSANRPLIES